MSNDIIFSDATKLAELIRTEGFRRSRSCRHTSIASKP